MTKTLKNLREYLTLNNPVRVKFTKQDGTEREMLCTQNLNQIPENHHPKGSYSNITSSTNIKVFDLEKNDWRSFNEDTVKHFHIVEK
jgi:predicted RNA-binding protein with RPS1 domain